MRLSRLSLTLGLIALPLGNLGAAEQRTVTLPPTPIDFISTNFENASPLTWEIDQDGAAQVYLVYDRERSSPNRANGHWHFQVHGKPGSNVTVVLNNLENIWNGVKASVAVDATTSVVSADGKMWHVVQTDLLPGGRLRLNLKLEGPALYVARIEPYRISDLEHFKATLLGNPLVSIATIGRTVGGRELELIRVGSDDAPRRVLIRARSHAWETGGNWAAEGLVRRLLRDDDAARRFRERYCLYLLPMANKDGVARGMTRFNALGKDLNRNWDVPADPSLAPENAALEAWIEGVRAQGRAIDLAIDLHNDDGGGLAFSRPDVEPDRYVASMVRFDTMLRKHTWFTEGSPEPSRPNAGTLGEGLWARYRVAACILELNANWIAGLKQPATAAAWVKFGEDLAAALYEYLAP